MANGQRSPIFKPSGTLEAVLSARTVLPINSSSSLSPPPLQKNQNLKPNLKGPLNPQPPILTQQMCLLPTALERELPETRLHSLAFPPPKQETMTPKPQKRVPPHLHWPRPEANTYFLRELAGPEGPTQVHVPFSISDMSQIEEKLGSFSENPTR